MLQYIIQEVIFNKAPLPGLQSLET